MFPFYVLNRKKFMFHTHGQIPNTSITTTAFMIIKVISLNITSLMCQYCKQTDTTMLLTSESKEAMLVKNTAGCSCAFLSLIAKN